ncbi:hypothetical protein CDD83_5099 [Cordyceps sp. RAO-2017]|nr:hypothetical protein CDD83_5099 [Cordyceps sp. RAO-2017]
MLALGFVASLLLSASHAVPCGPAKYSSVVVFGDSYSDNGNGFAMTNQTWPADPAYYKGRFSNGPVWPEYLAASLGIPLHDHAHGGATTSNALVRGYTGRKGNQLVPSLEDQVDKYLSTERDEATPVDSALFILWGGVNDALANQSITPAQSANVLSSLVTKLQDAGAAHFLLLGFPDLSMIPWDSLIDGASREMLHDYSVGLGEQLGRLAERVSMSSEARANYISLAPLFHSFGFYKEGWKAAGFDQFGLYGSCLVGAYTKAPRTLCADPEKRVYWDEFHPSRKAHELIAKTIRKTL